MDSTFWRATWPFSRFPLYCCCTNSDLITSFPDQRNHLPLDLFFSSLPISSSFISKPVDGFRTVAVCRAQSNSEIVQKCSLPVFCTIRNIIGLLDRLWLLKTCHQRPSDMDAHLKDRHPVHYWTVQSVVWWRCHLWKRDMFFFLFTT